MNIENAKLVYFSPTGTSGRVADAIARGLALPEMEMIDITTLGARKQPLHATEDELLVIAVPVYMGRVPALLGQWLSAMRLEHTPTVCVVVYGNRAFENALRELKDIVTERGGIPIAGAAYIGEHSFADAGAPVAMGRPNADDVRHAREFGRKIMEKIQSSSAASTSELAAPPIPGDYPYEGRTVLWDVDFIAVDESCQQCGLCAEVCPMDAIDPDDGTSIDMQKCITCCACIKKCPQGARSMKPGPVKDAQQRLLTLYSEPKTPECFL